MKTKGVSVLVAGSLLQLFLGIIYVWSKFVKPVSAQFGWAIDDVKLTSSFMLCCFVLGILMGGRLLQKFKPSLVVLGGGLSVAVGFVITSFLPVGSPVFLIYISYGVLGGFGVGAAYNTIITCAQRWFPQKRALATGISVCMFGFSTVIFAPLVELLVKQTSLTLTLRILALAFGAVTLLVFKFITLPESTATAGGTALTGLNMKEAVRTKEFWLLTFSLMFSTAPFFILNPSINGLAPIYGLTPEFGTVLVIITGVANAVGRLAVPMLGGAIGSKKAAIVNAGLIAVGTAALLFLRGGAFAVAVGLVAMCYGGLSGIYPLLTADALGLKNMATNYGAVMCGFMASSLIFPVIVGQFSTAEDTLPIDNNSKFVVLAVIAAVAMVLLLLTLGRKKR
ncbi:putative oxalate:formate antiporter [Clostridia bacterium]|nr:putative oxalate:formate antiporter [Clostridia bacterium]